MAKASKETRRRIASQGGKGNNKKGMLYLQARAVKAGEACKEQYGQDFYRLIRRLADVPR